jgi:hypothetical protein
MTMEWLGEGILLWGVLGEVRAHVRAQLASTEEGAGASSRPREWRWLGLTVAGVVLILLG